MSFSDLYLSSQIKTKQVDANTLQIRVPDTTNLWDPKKELQGNPAPFIFQKAKGDFQICLKVSGKFANQYDQAGILIKESKRRYMRCGIEVSDNTYRVTDSAPKAHDKYISTCFVSEGCLDSSRMPLVNKTREKTTAYWFKVKRRGETLIAYCSEDGKIYRPIRVLSFTSNRSLSVGMYGACPFGSNGLRVQFSDFEIRELSTKTLRNMHEDLSGREGGSAYNVYGNYGPHDAPVSSSRRSRSSYSACGNSGEEDDFSIVDSESEPEDRRGLYNSDDEADYHFKSSSRNHNSAPRHRSLQTT